MKNHIEIGSSKSLRSLLNLGEKPHNTIKLNNQIYIQKLLADTISRVKYMVWSL